METATESIPVIEACRISGAFPSQFYSLIASQRLAARKDEDGVWRIDRESFEGWLERRRQRRMGTK